MLINQIQEQLKQAQLAKDESKVSTLRLLLSEIHNAKIAKGRELSDQEIIQVTQKEIKKRTEAAAAFRSGSREDQAQKEELEFQILKQYLPKAISNEELTKIVEDTINELGTTSINDMGKVMGVVMGKVQGRAEGSTVSSLVKEKLTTKV